MSDKEHLPEIGNIDQFIQLQQQEVSLRFEQVKLRQIEVESNERIALASIQAQKETDLKRGDAFNNIYNKRFWIWFLAISAVAAVVVCAMFTGHTEVALEIIKIGGAALLAYFAGIQRGKTAILEQQDKDA